MGYERFLKAISKRERLSTFTVERDAILRVPVHRTPEQHQPFSAWALKDNALRAVNDPFLHCAPPTLLEITEATVTHLQQLHKMNHAELDVSSGLTTTSLGSG
jgi:hypothetical protein